MKTILKIQTIALIVFATAFLYACGNEQTEKSKPVRPVRYTTVSYTENGPVRTFSGTTVAKKVINLSFRQSGKIVMLDLRPGQKVTKGQLLARLDNVQTSLALEQARAQLLAAESNLTTARLNLDRFTTLYEKGTAALSDFEQAKNNYNTAYQSKEAAAKGVDMLEEQIDFGHIYAPASGTIASISAELNENIGPGMPIAILNAKGAMEIKLGIPESLINEISEGMNVNVSFPSIQSNGSLGKVTEVSPANDPNTATYEVTVEITHPHSAIRSGMAAEVIFQFGKATRNNPRMIVPANAVGDDSEGSFVFLIQEKGDEYQVKKQHITVGGLSSQGFEVISGLKGGEMVATAGLQTLLNGQNIKLQ